jgi:uncharacterized circularly permuted ATP-grasp superfamily protein
MGAASFPGTIGGLEALVRLGARENTGRMETSAAGGIVQTGGLFDGYLLGAAYDEMFGPGAQPRAHYVPLYRRLSAMSPEEFRRRKAMSELSTLEDGVGFTVYRQEAGIERVWPMDPVPCIIPANEWAHIERRLAQHLLVLAASMTTI